MKKEPRKMNPFAKKVMFMLVVVMLLTPILSACATLKQGQQYQILFDGKPADTLQVVSVEGGSVIYAISGQLQPAAQQGQEIVYRGEKIKLDYVRNGEVDVKSDSKRLEVKPISSTPAASPVSVPPTTSPSTGTSPHQPPASQPPAAQPPAAQTGTIRPGHYCDFTPSSNQKMWVKAAETCHYYKGGGELRAEPENAGIELKVGVKSTLFIPDDPAKVQVTAVGPDINAVMPKGLPQRECEGFRDHERLPQPNGQQSHFDQLGGDKGLAAILGSLIAGRNFKLWTDGLSTVISFAWGHAQIFLKWGTGNATMYPTTWEYVKSQVSGGSWKEVTSPKGLNAAKADLVRLADCHKRGVPDAQPQPVPVPQPAPIILGTPTPGPAMPIPNGVFNPDNAPIPANPIPVYFIGMDPIPPEQIAVLIGAGIVVAILAVGTPGLPDEALIIVLVAAP